MGTPIRGDLPPRALCAFPRCPVPTPFNTVTGVRARCCGSAHERAFVLLGLCPSAVPAGPLVPISVFGPGLGAWSPTVVLVSLDMLVGSLVQYLSVIFFDQSPLEGVALPSSFLLRLMPGPVVVSDEDSYLLYPPALGISVLRHLRCLGQDMTLHGVGMLPRSVLTITRLPGSLLLAPFFLFLSPCFSHVVV